MGAFAQFAEGRKHRHTASAVSTLGLAAGTLAIHFLLGDGAEAAKVGVLAGPRLFGGLIFLISTSTRKTTLVLEVLGRVDAIKLIFILKEITAKVKTG